MNDQMREEFEVWAFRQCFELRTDGASYYHHRTSDAWEAWQASRASIPAGFTAVDMATAAADGFRDGAAQAQAAILTLQGQGYTYHGGQLWKPPIGQEPRFDLIDQLKAENEALREEIAMDNKIIADRERLLSMFECPEHGQCVPYAMEQVEALRKSAPSKEIIWCACGDGHAANSYGAGFMDANNGVCENCDAAMSKEPKG